MPQDIFDKDMHRKLAASLFNHTWDLMEKANRTVLEDDEMVHSAHASRYHWGIAGTAVNLARGEWQISRVYSLLGRYEAALHHANRCLTLCTEHHLSPFDFAFAHEALARAYSVAKDNSKRDAHIMAAQDFAKHIKEKDSFDLLQSDLATIR